MSLLGHPDGVCALANPANMAEDPSSRDLLDPAHARRRPHTPKGMWEQGKRSVLGDEEKDMAEKRRSVPPAASAGRTTYVATLTSEVPNTHVNNYNGKLTLPPNARGEASDHAPLNAENVLLRGAVLRNTEWVIGLAVFTGADTKLVMNSVATPSKFSQLDMLINRTVFLILWIMIVCVCSLGAASVYVANAHFDELWYVGYNAGDNVGEPWPYFNLPETAKLGGSQYMGTPEWETNTQNFMQNTFMFVTMLSNFIPLSLYVSVEIITMAMMLLVGWDLHMYHEESDTPAAARSTIVTDLGQVEYVFSDKTGTLTSNIMEFKRCSVDGHVFGMPIAKAAPQGQQGGQQSGQGSTLENIPESLTIDGSDLLMDSVHPLRHLLAGSGCVSPGSLARVDENASIDENGEEVFVGERENVTERLTFDAEMFLRVMSICHTVVVEKDNVVPASEKVAEINSTTKKKKKRWTLMNSKGKRSSSPPSSSSSPSHSSSKPYTPKRLKKKKRDGAPEGCAYQAESPDEGALVAAASNEYGFQVLGRNSSGVQLSCSCPSLLQDEGVVQGLKNGTATASSLASGTMGGGASSASKYSRSQVETVDAYTAPRLETWPILAVNKFDSNRKRMSVLVRSPPELGSIPMLLCKGADSSMLLEGVAEGAMMLEGIGNGKAGTEESDEGNNPEMDSLLGLQAHLGEFASEGLRTLVLAVKILSDEDAERWLAKFKEASTSIDDRDKKLTDVAYEIEKGLHIVGATAIEDKLQDGVPETIANLEKAGIKLWVLTGDKRETAIEIGYSTKVLTPKMHLTEVVDGPAESVKALVAMELMRHVKIGNLPDYQLAGLETTPRFSWKSLLNSLEVMGHYWRKLKLLKTYYYLTMVKRLWLNKDKYADYLEDIEEDMQVEKRRMDPRIQRRKVRELARQIIEEFWKDPRHSLPIGSSADEASIVSDDPPAVFERARSAKEKLQTRRQSQGAKTPANSDRVKHLALAKVSINNKEGFDEEALSMHSFLPPKQADNFDKKKRTVFERLFAVDKDVRHGKLSKHLKNEYRDALALDEKEQTGKKDIESMVGTAPTSHPPKPKGHFDITSVKRGLVVEGAALKHLLGDPVLEEMLFAVASCSDSVIACRVSPIQKALLLKMVRKYVSPTPTTLAIGDGANDVGMIQEAHVGIGISGLEGQQAVNASDFSIAQFRYLESLLLIHGRWNFMRMSKAVLFFFYKNSLLIGLIIIYSEHCLHSGTLLFDQWVISVFNFVGASMVCVYMAIFDRDLPRDYVMRNPQVYKSGPSNEFLSLRMTMRWIVITFVQVFVIYHFTAHPITLGGGVTSAFKGLMGNRGRDVVGDGEGGDLQVFGTTIYTQLIYVVIFKALFETKSIVNGEFPTFTCRRDKGEGWWNRIGYTWVGVTWFSVFFYFFFIFTYQLIGREGPQVGTFFPMVYVTEHVFNMRSITWMVSILTPTIAVMFDVTPKVISNMFYPTQTQIHAEIALNESK